jgi:hypothetical protein
VTIFEYVTVAVSLVLSLGLVRLLEGSLSAFSPSRVYPIHAVWLVIKLINHFLYWWMLWRLRGGEVEWNFPFFLFIALPAVVLYLQSTLLVSPSPREVSSWREHYYSIAPVFFGLNVVYALVQASIVWIGAGELYLSAIGMVGVAILASVAAMLSSKPWLHVVVVTLMIGINALAISSLSFSPPPE